MRFGDSAKKWVAEALFFVTWTTHHFCHFPWIDFLQTSHEHVSMQVVSRDIWFHIPEKFPLRDRISRKTLFLGYPICDREAVPIPTSAIPTGAIPTVPIPTCVIPTTRSTMRTVHCEKFGIKRLLKISPYHKSVTTLPCEILISEIYSVFMYDGALSCWNMNSPET